MPLIDASSPEHICTPPLVERVSRVDSARLVRHVPPADGSTWDCERCGRVWVVKTPQSSRYRYGYAAPATPRWTPAGWIVTRRHLDSVGGGLFRRNQEVLRTGRGSYVFPGGTVPPPPPPDLAAWSSGTTDPDVDA